MTEIKLFENENGYAIEEKEESRIKIFEYGVQSFDGIIDKTVFETWITYSNGLFQSWDVTGYFAQYMDMYKSRDAAIREAKLVLGIEKRKRRRNSGR